MEGVFELAVLGDEDINFFFFFFYSVEGVSIGLMQDASHEIN